MRITALAAIAASLLAIGAPASASGDGQLYEGLNLVDPEKGTERPNAWILVRDRLIVQVGTGRSPRGDYERHDMHGLYAMPGLIDAHAHIVTGPFVTKIVNGAPAVEMVAGDRYTRFNAAVALAFGVTTLRNPGGSTIAAQRYDAMLASGEWVGPEARHAGAIIEPPPLSGESFAYPRTPAAWDAEAANQAAAGMTYFKLYHDLSATELAEGVRAAKAHGLIPIAHLESVSWTTAAELGVQQIEHTLPVSGDLLEPDARADYAEDMPPSHGYFQWFELAKYDGRAIRQMIRTLRKKHVIVTPTLTVQDIVYHMDDLSSIFPANELRYYQPESFASAKANYDQLAKIWPHDDFLKARATWPKVLRFVKLLHDSGIRLMIGTDGTGGAPLYTRELHNMTLAGIPAMEVLRMATAGNAKLMSLTDTGRIAPGLEADIIFLRANPAADVRNVEQVEATLSNGRLYRFDDLIALAESLTK